jgi:hypothetical protein
VTHAEGNCRKYQPQRKVADVQRGFGGVDNHDNEEDIS